MAIGVTERLAALPRLSKAELRAMWKDLVGTKTPDGLRRGPMIRILAYAMQEQAFGGLSERTRNRLHELATGFSGKAANSLPTARIKPGTRLVREWQQQKHVVNVEERSFEYRGTHYDSLSQIARLITGTRWSGPLFFGVKSRSSSKMEAAR